MFAVLSSISNTLDPLSFTNSLVNAAAISKFKMSIGATSTLPPNIPDDLWCDKTHISLMIY